jgi:D-beta-D-heptose 7-phosphate kinase/D-beta-D-heptose 1-phosphate adenosyltransferase
MKAKPSQKKESKKSELSIQAKIQSPQQLQKTLSRIKNSKVVFTNGCFDILHAGHVTYLEKAKKLGTHLIIALNSDDSVKKLKGPSRPIHPLQDRLTVIAALGSVDYVTWFQDETPLKLIKKLKPNGLVKGGDYKVQDIVGYNEVKAHGGFVKTIPFLKGRSTTKTLQKVSKNKS